MQTDRRPRLRVRFEVIDGLLESLGHHTDVAKGEFLGVADTTISRNRAGTVEPSGVLMGAIQSAFPTVPFGRLFEQVAVESATKPKPTGPSGPATTGPKPAKPKAPPTKPRQHEAVAP